MKISRDESHGGLIYTFVTFQYPHILAPVRFYVDTGSPQTLLSDQDVKRINFPTRNLDFNKTSLIGGTSIAIADVGRVTLYFKTDDGKTWTYKPSKFYISQSKRSGKHSNPYYPSVLGTDFIEENKFKLVFDPSKNIAHLEKE